MNIIYRVQFAAGKKIISIIEWIISFFVQKKAIQAKENFDWVKKLEENYKQILQEYNNVEKLKSIDVTIFSEEQKKSVEPNYWNIVPLKSYGNVHKTTAALCPLTFKIVNSIPNCTTAWFSIMKPGTIVEPHRGTFKGYLRCLLALKTPINKEESGLAIEGENYFFEKGVALMFDDTYIHSAYNKSDMQRVVLYIDILRPLPYGLFYISKIINFLISNSRYVKGFKYNK